MTDFSKIDENHDRTYSHSIICDIPAKKTYPPPPVLLVNETIRYSYVGIKQVSFKHYTNASVKIYFVRSGITFTLNL